MTLRWSSLGPPRIAAALTVGTGVLLLSPDALWIRLLATGGWTVMFWRGACTAIGYLVLARATSGRVGERGTAGARWAIGGLTAIGNACFVYAVMHTTAAQTLVILGTSPLLGAIITHLRGLEPIDRRTWLSTAIVVPCTAALVIRPGEITLSFGDLAALTGALALATLLVVVRSSGVTDAVPALALGGALTAVVAAPFADVLALRASDVLVLVVGFAIMLPLSLSLIIRGPRYLAPPEVGLIMLLETVLGPLWVWLALGEKPTSQVALAGAVIVATLAVSALVALYTTRTAPRGPTGE